jgi:hypothetical protein
MIEVTGSALAAHPFLRGMTPGHLDALAEAGTDVTFPAGYRIFEDGGFAGKFWLIQSGHAALDMNVPGEGRVIIDNVGMGELLGLSSARATSPRPGVTPRSRSPSLTACTARASRHCC